MPVEDCRKLAAYLIALRHKDLPEYSTAMARKIDDVDTENWLSPEEYDARIAT